MGAVQERQGVRCYDITGLTIDDVMELARAGAKIGQEITDQEDHVVATLGRHGPFPFLLSNFLSSTPPRELFFDVGVENFEALPLRGSYISKIQASTRKARREPSWWPIRIRRKICRKFWTVKKSWRGSARSALALNQLHQLEVHQLAHQPLHQLAHRMAWLFGSEAWWKKWVEYNPFFVDNFLLIKNSCLLKFLWKKYLVLPFFYAYDLRMKFLFKK